MDYRTAQLIKAETVFPVFGPICEEDCYSPVFPKSLNFKSVYSDLEFSVSEPVNPESVNPESTKDDCFTAKITEKALKTVSSEPGSEVFTFHVSFMLLLPSPELTGLLTLRM